MLVERDVLKRIFPLIKASKANQYITILGTAQDGGFPHIGCQKKCCDDFYKGMYHQNKR